MYAAIGVSGSAALIALVMLPFAPQPALVSAPYLLASCALQVVYTVLVAKTYQVSDMSQTYPLMRGTARVAGGGDKRAVPRRSSVAAGLAGYRRHLPGDSGDGL